MSFTCIAMYREYIVVEERGHQTGVTFSGWSWATCGAGGAGVSPTLLLPADIVSAVHRRKQWPGQRAQHRADRICPCASAPSATRVMIYLRYIMHIPVIIRKETLDFSLYLIGVCGYSFFLIIT